NPIPPSMVRWSKRWEAGEKNKEVLRGILEETSAKSASAPAGSIEQQIGDYYGACMDEKRIDALGVKPLQPELKIVRGMKSPKDVQKVITRFIEQAIYMPIYFGSTPDPQNPSKVIADTGASGLGLPERDYYFKDDDKSKETREKYIQHVTATFKLAGHDDQAAAAAAQTVMRMEKALAEASLTNVELRDPYATFHKMKLSDVQKMSPNFNWAEYFKAVKLDSAVDFNVQEPKFLKEFDRQLKETPVADWRTYLEWHLLRAASPYLSTPFVQANFSFYNQYLAGAREMKPRWKRCSEFADAHLGEALGQKYVQKTFPPEAKARIQELVKNLLLAMGDDIKSLTWMGEETKKKALAKLATFKPKVGYPDKWKDYSSVRIRRDSFWNNVLEGRRFAIRDDLQQIGKPVDRGRWFMTPPTSNAYYSPLRNEIVFPAGILLPPLFDVNATDAVNYGGIGPVIGHEISHGFDDYGAKYDADGRLQNWWTDTDNKEFERRGACVVKQFDNYEVEGGMKHKGKLVLGESIGDLGGVKLAYMAFLKSMEGKPRPPDIDGFTPVQQFFISWGQSRGDAIRPETQRQMALTDPHPIGKYRVNGPFSNFEPFHEAFGCKEGDPMVRAVEQRCEVW
ncbi:MAG: M13 family metallopeptidase, partial [Acidobacteriales bacterium]|nr:M13 family metallopeptidase [Terriglobales bacterium]